MRFGRNWGRLGMRSEWKEVKLKDVCEIIDPHPSHRAPKIVENGIAFAGIGDIDEYGNIDYIKSRKVSPDILEEQKQTYDINNNTIAYGRVGTVGKITYFGNQKRDFTLSPTMAIINPKSNINPYFLKAYLPTNQFWSQVYGKMTGSTRPSIGIQQLRELTIPIPSVEEQKYIGSIWKIMHNKIELNNKINENLEQQAQAIFDDMFPYFMKNTVPMNEIIDVRDGTHDSPKSQETGYPLITSKHLLPYSVNKKEANLINEDDYIQVNERSKVEYGDILISMIGTVGLISFVSDSPVDFAIKNVGLFKTSKSIEYCFYILSYLKSKDVLSYIEQHLAGTTQKYISLKELRNLPINVPTSDKLNEFNLLVKPIYESIIINIKENQRLAELRDTLLPKLMNGEIDVSKVKIERS